MLGSTDSNKLEIEHLSFISAKVWQWTDICLPALRENMRLFKHKGLIFEEKHEVFFLLNRHAHAKIDIWNINYQVRTSRQLFWKSYFYNK